MALNKALLDLLVCPTCRTAVEPIHHEQGLFCHFCNKVYPVQDDIPVMMEEHAIAKEIWDQKHSQ